MGSGGRRSPKGGLSNTGGAQKLKFKAMDPAAQNSMLAVQRQKQTGAALKAIHNYTDPTCYASNGFNHAQNLNQALNTGRPLTAKQKATESGLKSIMTPMKDNYILYRGDHDDMLKRIGINMQQFNSTRSQTGDTQLQQALVGQSWVNKGFTSTSHTKGNVAIPSRRTCLRRKRSNPEHPGQEGNEGRTYSEKPGGSLAGYGN
jgi:hypothetical protein